MSPRDAVAGDQLLDAAVAKAVAHPSFAGTFKHPVKFNGTDFVETRLSEQEVRAEVSKLATTKLHVFLERYGALLSAEELRGLAAAPGAETAECRFWFERLLAAPISETTRQKRVRRRRWLWAQRQMEMPTGFFSEDNMKQRDPKLFYTLVGRHLDPTTSLSAPMQGSLSSYLMQRLEQECQLDGRGGAGGGATGSAAGAPEATAGSGAPEAKMDCDADAGAKRQRSEQQEDEDAMSDDEEEFSGDAAGGAPDDVAVLRARLLKTMRDRFVNGDEPGFEYKRIDEDSDLDDVVELGRDAEEKYFDDDGGGLTDDEDL
eukprot:TRINITY_DN23874_c0_g1_i1.p1 TRINITY_DN23874_c0_g1~~TRINITY_DN23874_c0_g1_i1.p1  ORF type:complete len:317 (-),score=114.92 TRINITY_DN23874_c0_g1_i1:63-1013(-)